MEEVRMTTSLDSIRNKLKIQTEKNNRQRTINELDRLVETFDSCMKFEEIEHEDVKNDNKGYICANYKEIIEKNGITGLGNFDDIEIIPDERSSRYFEVETTANIDPIYVTPPLLIQMLIRKAFPFFISTYDVIINCKMISRLFFLRPNIWKDCNVRSFTVYIKKKILSDIDQYNGLKRRSTMKEWMKVIEDNINCFTFKDKESETKFKNNYKKNITKSLLSNIFSIQWFHTNDCLDKIFYIEYYIGVLSSDTLYLNNELIKASKNLIDNKISIDEYKGISKSISLDNAFINVATIFNILARCVIGISGLGEQQFKDFTSMIPYEYTKIYENKTLEEEKQFVNESIAEEYSRIIYMRNDNITLGHNCLEDIKNSLNLNGNPNDDLYLLNAYWHCGYDIEYKIKKITERFIILNASEVKSKFLNPDHEFVSGKIDFHIRSRNCNIDLPPLDLLL